MRMRKYAAAAVMTAALSGAVAFAAPAAASTPATGTSVATVDEAPSVMANCEYYYDRALYYYRLAAAYRSEGKVREALIAEDVADDYMLRYRRCS